MRRAGSPGPASSRIAASKKLSGEAVRAMRGPPGDGRFLNEIRNLLYVVLAATSPSWTRSPSPGAGCLRRIADGENGRRARMAATTPATEGPDVYRGGSGSPLVLLHGAAMSWRAWEPVLEPLGEYHRVVAPTLPGHRGGPAWDADGGPFTIDRLVDGVCEQLDAEGIDTAHVVGNSLGGWVALELVRRGRARSAVAISPAGGWRSGWDLRRLLWSFRVLRVIARPSSLAAVLAERPRPAPGAAAPHDGARRADRARAWSPG